MGMLAQAVVERSRRLNKSFDEDFWQELSTLRSSVTGRSVTLNTALQVATIFSGCRVIGNGMAQVPLKLMRRSEDGRRRVPATDHPLYELMALRPNHWQSSFEFRQMISWHTELCGNAFVFINRVGRKIVELIPFNPGTITVKQSGKYVLSYEVTTVDGEVKPVPVEAMWHIRGPSINGFQGMDVVAMAREAIGLAMATEEAVGRLHSNGVRSSGVYSVDGQLSQDQYKQLRDWIAKEYGGMENTGKPMILDRGAKFLNTAMTGVDAQTNETRNAQIQQICSFMGIAPLKVGYSDKTATFASTEEMNRAHKEDCLAPRWESLEQSMNLNLLTKEERAEGLYFNFVEEGMARGSIKDTKDAILGYVNGGVMTANEGRALLDLNPDQDPNSDKLRIPVNVANIAAQDGGAEVK